MGKDIGNYMERVALRAPITGVALGFVLSGIDVRVIPLFRGAMHDGRSGCENLVSRL